MAGSFKCWNAWFKQPHASLRSQEALAEPVAHLLAFMAGSFECWDAWFKQPRASLRSQAALAKPVAPDAKPQPPPAGFPFAAARPRYCRPRLWIEDALSRQLLTLSQKIERGRCEPKRRRSARTTNAWCHWRQSVRPWREEHPHKRYPASGAGNGRTGMAIATRPRRREFAV
jgi:hypothetical protein